MKIGKVDFDTGEILPKQKRFSKVMDNKLREIVSDKGLTGTDIRVLLLLIAEMDYENVARIKQDDIVKMLGVSRQQVSLSLSVLNSKRYVITNNRVRPQAYSISESLAQRGVKTVKV